MKVLSAGEFQNKVADSLVRHRSILDTLSKLQESSAKVNRNVFKAVTCCGCLSIKAQKQAFPPDVALKDCMKHLDSHLEGALCEECREVIAEDLFDNLFYIAALCHLLGYNLETLLEKGANKLNTLGYFNMY